MRLSLHPHSERGGPGEPQGSLLSLKYDRRSARFIGLSSGGFVSMAPVMCGVLNPRLVSRPCKFIAQSHPKHDVIHRLRRARPNHTRRRGHVSKQLQIENFKPQKQIAVYGRFLAKARDPRRVCCSEGRPVGCIAAEMHVTRTSGRVKGNIVVRPPDSYPCRCKPPRVEGYGRAGALLV